MNFGKLEARTIEKYNTTLRSYRTGQVPADKLTDVLETKALTEWDTEHNTFAMAAGLSGLNSIRLKEAAQKQRLAGEQMMELSKFLQQQP